MPAPPVRCVGKGTFASCALSSGHLISSSGENAAHRFNMRRDRNEAKKYLLLSNLSLPLRVNFHTKKPMTQMTATPPATDNPMTVELEIPELPLELLLPGVCVGVDELDAWSEITTTLVTTWPP